MSSSCYPFSYKPDCVLITGATGDFGRAFVERFSALGCRLVLTGRSAEKLSVLQDSLDVPVYTGVADMRDPDSIRHFVDGIPPEFQAVDLLVNNAGLALGLGKAQDSDIADWETMIDVNNKGLVVMTRLILDGMCARRKGHVINISSTAGNYPYPGGHVYCASKAFVTQFSLALRADLAGTDVRVTNIEPGMVETQFSTVRFKGDESAAAAVYADTSPLQAEDVAESVFWAATLPPHFNVNRLEIMPTVQSFGPLPVERSVGN